jgi:hypothetical protein
MVAVLIGLFFANYQFTQKNPGGNDFLVHWVGTQNFIRNGDSPYSSETTLNIQNLVYGRAAESNEHELRVAYPLYSIFLFMPFALVSDYFIARALWMVFLEISLFFTLVISLKIVQWKPDKLIFVLLFVFSIFWYHGLRTLVNGNVVLLLLFSFVLSLYAIQQRQYEIAGILLALVTIKPQVGFVFIFFIIFWSIINKKGKIIFWFFGTTILLVLLALFLIPDWPLQFVREVLLYPGYNPPGTPSSALAELLPGVGKQIGLGISIVSGIILIIEWWLAKNSKGVEFIWVAALTLILSQWLNIQTDPGNFIIMFPAVIIIFKLISDRWKNRGTVINLFILLVLFITPWYIFLNSISYEYQPIQSPLMFFPLPFLLLILMYWVRWWAKNPVKHILDD